jgi:hypothetical protein
MGFPWEWDFVAENLGMGMGKSRREWEGMGMARCTKFPGLVFWLLVNSCIWAEKTLTKNCALTKLAQQV